MNKQELIEKYEDKLKDSQLTFGANFKTKVYEGLVEDLRQLDEPKVTIPQFVADWYEKHKDDLEYDIWEYILRWGKQQPSEFYEWMNHANNKPFQTLVNMHQFGYEVEKEKRYLVKMKGMIEDFTVLKLDKIRDGWYLGNDTEYSYTKGKHTREELEKAGFEWVFNCPGIEIEEVQDDSKI